MIIAAERAARSALACARWRASTAEPTVPDAIAITRSTAMNNAPSTVAEPLSVQSLSGRFDRRDCLCPNRKPGKHRSIDRNGGNHESALASHSQHRSARGDAANGDSGRPVVAARCEPRGFPGGVNTPHLRRDCHKCADAESQHGNQRGDGERRLNRARPAVTGQTLVFSALAMMPVNAATTESPVTTVYRMAPNAAAAQLPMAYSTVCLCTHYM
jgi:hypothetical protein